MTNYFRKPDALVDAVKAVLSGQPVEVNETNKNDKSDDGEGLDAVQPNAVKKKFKDRKDKDIDNDGDVDSSDEYLHKRRKAVSKAMKEEDNPANRQHLCAKNVVHESWGEGSCIPTMHADPDEDGNIEWYDVMFDHGIEEQVSIEELKVTKAESHMHSSKKKIKESKDEDDDDMEDDDDDDMEDDDGDEDEENGKKKKVSGKKDVVDVKPEIDDAKMVNEKEMTPAQEKKREEIVLSMKKEMPRFKKKYGDRAKDVMYATATKMAMKEGFELGIDKSDLIEEVELDEAKVTKKERDRLEDQNEHGLLALKLAKAYGTPAEVKKIEAINKKHQKDGSIERKDQQERDSISNKYYKMAEETELDEGRGRPRKDGTTGGSEDRENIQMQLRKSVSLRGLKDVEFADGKKVKVPAKVAQGVMSKINSIKDAKQKQNAVQHISKSHKHMMDFHKGDYKDADAKRQDILKLK